MIGNPLIREMLNQARQRNAPFVPPRGPATIEESMRHLWMSPEGWLNDARPLPDPEPLTPWHRPLSEN